MRDTRIKRYERAIDQAWKNSQIWRPSTAEGQNRNQPREYGSHCTHRQETKTNQRNHTYMTPRDDGLSGQPKKRKMGKCRERPALQDMAEKVAATQCGTQGQRGVERRRRRPENTDGHGLEHARSTDRCSVLRPFTYSMT